MYWTYLSLSAVNPVKYECDSMELTHIHLQKSMMTSSNGNIFRVTGICEGNAPVTGEFPHKGQKRRALMFSLICDWINGQVNHRDAGDLKHHRAHYDVNVMYTVPVREFD